MTFSFAGTVKFVMNAMVINFVLCHSSCIDLICLTSFFPQQPQVDSSDETVSQEGVPQGYEAVSLIKALNGSTSSSTPTNPSQPPPDGKYCNSYIPLLTVLYVYTT